MPEKKIESETPEASVAIVWATPRPGVPPLKASLPLDSHSIDEGVSRGYCQSWSPDRYFTGR